MTTTTTTTNNDNQVKTFLVAGAGMAGLAMAKSLASSDPDRIRVEIIEKRKDALEQKGSAYGLAPNGQKSMEYISPNTLDHCKKVGIPMQNGGLLLPWFEVREQLWQECEKLPNITFRTGLSLADIREEPSGTDNTNSDGGVVVTFQDSDVEVRGDALIGADGVRSTVRNLLDLPPAQPMGSIMWRGQVNTNNMSEASSSVLSDLHDDKRMMDPSLPHVIAAGKTMVMLFSFNTRLPGVLAWVVSSQNPNIRDGTTPWELFESEPNFEESVSVEKRTMLKHLFAESDPRDLAWHTPLCVTPLTESSVFGKGRVTLVGDAAHAIMPTSGLGGALAFEDAVVLTKLLKENEYENISDVFRTYQERRVPRVSLIAAEQAVRAKTNRAVRSLAKVAPWSKDFQEWVYMGPDAPSRFVSETGTDPLKIVTVGDSEPGDSPTPKSSKSEEKKGDDQ